MLRETEPGPHRPRLEFAEAVTASFTFVSEYGLHQVRAEPTFVRYESDRVFLNVYHGRASYVIGAEIGQLGTEVKYGLDYMVIYAGARERERFDRPTLFQVHTRRGVARVVPQVAELVKKYGRDLLLGRDEFYRHLDEVNKRSAKLGARRDNVQWLRSDASRAWRRRDWRRVADLYAAMEDDLTLPERKRLEDARNRILRGLRIGVVRPHREPVVPGGSGSAAADGRSPGYGGRLPAWLPPPASQCGDSESIAGFGVDQSVAGSPSPGSVKPAQTIYARQGFTYYDGYWYPPDSGASSLVGKPEPGPYRPKLEFPKVVAGSFAFVEDYGLHQVKAEPTFVRYESDRVFLNVCHGRASYIIEAEIGQLGSQVRYGLDYMVAYAGAWEREGFGRHIMFQVNTREGVARFVPRVADLIKRYGWEFLLGRDEFFKQLDEANRRVATMAERRRKLVTAREDASMAWKRRDWRRVAEIYTSIEDDLSELERKTLEYARKHVASPQE